ncbi:MAG: UDP-N-acetylmuramoyl-tripeptide--D-alanyl-D-alanine ligase [Pseudomonadota bacterium]
MIEYSLDQASAIVQGRLHGRNAHFSGLAHDSRALQANQLFAALPGAHVDGHDYIAQVAQVGAAGALVREPVQTDLSQIQVPDVCQAMGTLAAAWRASLDVHVVGITGSNGKTTVKNMLASIVARYAEKNNQNKNNENNKAYLATPGNYNNEIGLPLTLAQLSPSHRYALLEMGCAKPGDIAYLADLACPSIGVVTNASAAHLKGLGSVEGVAATKGELFVHLDADGTAVMNRDDRFYNVWQDQARPARILSFGQYEQADVRLVLSNRVVTPAGDFTLQLKLPGRHNQLNALAATAAAIALKIDLPSIAQGLAEATAEPGRLQRLSLAGGLTLIDDSYNANPASMRAAIEVLSGHRGRTCLVIGDMAELADRAEYEHEQVGAQARALGVDALFAYGPLSARAVDAFSGPGATFDDIESLCESVLNYLDRTGDQPSACLVKGSRSMAMERVVMAIKQARAAAC